MSIDKLITEVERIERSLIEKKAELANALKLTMEGLEGQNTKIVDLGKVKKFKKVKLGKGSKVTKPKEKGITVDSINAVESVTDGSNKRRYTKITPELRDTIKFLKSLGHSALSISKSGYGSYQLVQKVLRGQYDSLK